MVFSAMATLACADGSGLEALIEAPVSCAGRTVEVGGSDVLPLDILFIIDSTASMKEPLPALKRAVLCVVDGVGAFYPRPDFRFGLVLFRDEADEYRTLTEPFTADPARFAAALAAAAARGGGDLPEDIGAALEAALATGWRRDALRLAFLVTDAAPRPAINGVASYARALESVRAAGIGVYALGIAGIPAEGERALRDIAGTTGGAYLAGGVRRDGVRRDGVRRDGVPDAVRAPFEDLALDIIAAELSAARSAAEFARRAALARLLDGVRARLEAGKSYPEAARRRGAEGTVRLSLRVGARGELLEARVAVTSGSALLDRAALELARASFPLDNPARREATLEIALRYTLGGATQGPAKTGAP